MKFLILFGLLTTSIAWSAPLPVSKKDTIPDSQIIGVRAGDLKKAAAIRAERDLLLQDIAVYKDDVRLLSARIQNLEKQLATADTAGAINQERIKGLQDQIALHKGNREDLDRKIAGLEKEVRKWRRKSFWANVGIVIVAIAGGILYFTK